MKFTVTALLGLLAALPVVANTAPPKNIRVCVQFIEMPHTSLTELMSGKAQPGHVLHEKAMAMTKEGKARMVESGMITGKPNVRTTVESFSEYIYQTEYEPSGMGAPDLLKDPYPLKVPRPCLVYPMQFETRNTGVSIELLSDSRPSSNVADVDLIMEITRLERLKTFTPYKDQWGDSSIRMPIFETWRFRHRLGANLGKFDLAATITPKPTEPVPATLRKILVFVRCDVIAVGKR